MKPGKGGSGPPPWREKESCKPEGYSLPVKNQPLPLHRGRKKHPYLSPPPPSVTSHTLLPSLGQLHQICCCTRPWCRRQPTSRTGPCTCSTAPQKKTAWPARPAQPTGHTATGVYSGSPPRSTTWDELTSGPKLGAIPGCGTSVMGERGKQKGKVTGDGASLLGVGKETGVPLSPQALPQHGHLHPL